MFSGIIRATGRITEIKELNTGKRITILPDKKLKARKGDSVCCDGICLTVETRKGNSLQFFISEQTLKVTTARKWQKGTIINMEESLRMSDLMGGHIVMGHVDTIARIDSIYEKGEGYLFIFELAKENPFIVPRGSVAINGISLTVATVQGRNFSIAIIPYTFKHTNLRYAKPGQFVNVEYDIIARYVNSIVGRYLEGNKPPFTGL